MAFRVTMPAAELDSTSRFCQCCGKPLRGSVVMLEMDQRDWTYHDRGGVPADKSQGWFPFGKTCAKKQAAR